MNPLTEYPLNTSAQSAHLHMYVHRTGPTEPPNTGVSGGKYSLPVAHPKQIIHYPISFISYVSTKEANITEKY